MLKRFVTYIYHYNQGKRGQNVGFVKADIRDAGCRMELQLRIPDRFQGKGTVYLIVSDEKTIGIPAGTITIHQGLGQLKLAYARSQIGKSGYSVNEIQAVAIRYGNERLLLSCWSEQVPAAVFHGKFSIWDETPARPPVTSEPAETHTADITNLPEPSNTKADTPEVSGKTGLPPADTPDASQPDSIPPEGTPGSAYSQNSDISPASDPSVPDRPRPTAAPAASEAPKSQTVPTTDRPETTDALTSEITDTLGPAYPRTTDTPHISEPDAPQAAVRPELGSTRLSGTSHISESDGSRAAVSDFSGAGSSQAASSDFSGSDSPQEAVSDFSGSDASGAADTSDSFESSGSQADDTSDNFKCAVTPEMSCPAGSPNTDLSDKPEDAGIVPDNTPAPSEPACTQSEASSNAYVYTTSSGHDRAQPIWKSGSRSPDSSQYENRSANAPASGVQSTNTCIPTTDRPQPDTMTVNQSIPPFVRKQRRRSGTLPPQPPLCSTSTLDTTEEAPPTVGIADAPATPDETLIDFGVTNEELFRTNLPNTPDEPATRQTNLPNTPDKPAASQANLSNSPGEPMTDQTNQSDTSGQLTANEHTTLSGRPIKPATELTSLHRRPDEPAADQTALHSWSGEPAADQTALHSRTDEPAANQTTLHNWPNEPAARQTNLHNRTDEPAANHARQPVCPCLNRHTADTGNPPALSNTPDDRAPAPAAPPAKTTRKKIALTDIRASLPKRNWYLCSNSFLIHGFFNYHYLILKTVEYDGQKKCYLGVPGIYEQPERAMAYLFGFTEFEPARPEECHTPKAAGLTPAACDTGVFGYWMLELLEET